MSFLGFPIARYIDIGDSEDVLRAIRFTPPDLPIDLFIPIPYRPRGPKPGKTER